MPKSIHFISGLPRSGSTMLSAILLQNHRFHASITSPVHMLCSSLQEKTCGGEFDPLFDDRKRAALLKGIFSSYYSDLSSEIEVLFDTNRAWTGRMAMLAALYPACRVICCVREVHLVVDSFERALQKNPLQLSRVFNMQMGASIYSRVEALMNPEDGAVGRALSTLREAWFGDFANKLIVIRYEMLATDPARTMAKLYETLGEKPFAHNFDALTYSHEAFDAHLGMPGLHQVKKRVAFEQREPVIPPDIVNRLAGANFWLNPIEKTKGVMVI